MLSHDRHIQVNCSDVLKRHKRTCQARPNDSELSSSGNEGQEPAKRACDRCFRLKRACDRQSPCGLCQSKLSACIYSRVSINKDGSEGTDDQKVVSEPTSSQDPNAPVLESLLVREPHTVDSLHQSYSSMGESADQAGAMFHQTALQPHEQPLPPLNVNPFPGGALSGVLASQSQRIEQPQASSLAAFLAHLGQATSSFGLFRSLTEEQGWQILRDNLDQRWTQRRSRAASSPLVIDSAHIQDSRGVPLDPAGYQGWTARGEASLSRAWAATIMSPGRPVRALSMGNEAYRAASSILTLSSHENDPYGSAALGWSKLQVLCSKIVNHIQEVSSADRDRAVIEHGWSPEIERACTDFFTPENCRKFVGLFFAAWYPHTPIIHKPTFEPAQASEALLAVICIFGGCFSPDLSHNQAARFWSNAVGQFIFIDAVLRLEASNISSLTESNSEKTETQLLQAIYLISEYQNWGGDKHAKKRLRRYRSSVVVALARDLDIAAAVHPEYGTSAGRNFDWQKFVNREELIRTIHFIFAKDICITMFSNLPPRMSIAEMKLSLCCPEECFQAETSDECLIELQMWMSTPNARLSLSTTLRSICRKVLDEPECMSFSNIGPLNLFLTTCAFYSILYHQHQSSLGFEAQLTPIRNGTANWYRIWYHMTSITPLLTTEFTHIYDLWRRIGFFRHAPEVNRLSADLTLGLTNFYADIPAAGAFASPSIITPFEVSGQQDESDSAQMNNLINFLQKFSF